MKRAKKKKLHGQNAHTKVFPRRSKICTHPQALLHTLYIYIYRYGHTREVGEKNVFTNTCSKICAWYHEKQTNKKGSTKAIQNAWMHESNNNKTAANHVTACKLAVILHAHSKVGKK